MDGLLSGAMADSGGSFVTAILVVSLGLVALALVFWLMKRRGLGASTAMGRKTQRLAVLDSAAVDTRRRLVLIRRDDVEHLLMIGGPTDIVIESRIGGSAEDESSLAGAMIDRPRMQVPAGSDRPLSERPPARAPQPPAEQFPAERFAEPPPVADRPSAASPPPAEAPEHAPGVRAGNPFDDADFSAVMEAEMERRSTWREAKLRLEPGARQQTANPERDAPASQDQGSLEDEMARLLADMTASKRN